MCDLMCYVLKLTIRGLPFSTVTYLQHNTHLHTSGCGLCFELNLTGDRVAGFVSMCQKHHKATAGKYYNTRPGKRDALIAKEIITLLFGKVLEYPATEEIQRLCCTELVSEWMIRYFRASRIKGMFYCWGGSY